MRLSAWLVLDVLQLKSDLFGHELQCKCIWVSVVHAISLISGLGCIHIASIAYCQGVCTSLVVHTVFNFRAAIEYLKAGRGIVADIHSLDFRPRYDVICVLIKLITLKNVEDS